MKRRHDLTKKTRILDRPIMRAVLPSIVLLLVVPFLVSPLFSAETEKTIRTVPEAAEKGFSAILSDDMRNIIETLSSDDFEGREADTRGERLASTYISSWLSAAGVQSWKGGRSLQDYVQKIPCISADVDKANSSVALKICTDIEKIFPLEKEAYFSPQSAESFSISAPVVFAGYGIDAPEYGYTDYGTFDVKGKIIIAFNHEPQEKDEKSVFRGTKMTRYSMPQIKAQIAKERGAVAIVIMRDRNNQHKSMGETLAQRGTQEERGHFLGIDSRDPLIPIFYLEDSAADEIFEGSGIDLKKKQEEIDATLKSEPVLLNDPLALTVVMKNRRKLTLDNIIAKVEGSEKGTGGEAVIIGAHYDHLGMKKEGIYHGADDNASGVAVLLDLVRAFSKNSAQPKRSIYFVFFAAEEKGVIGSRYFLENLPSPQEKISAMINLDELGRNNMDKEKNADMVIAYTSGQAPELKEIIKKENTSIGLDTKYYPTLKFMTNSDHSLFHDQGIPVIFFFAGFHDDYHKVTDTSDKINYPKLERIAKLVYLTAWDIATREGKIKFDASMKQEPEKDDFEKPF